MSISIFYTIQYKIELNTEALVLRIVTNDLLSKVGFHKSHRQSVGENNWIILERLRIQGRYFFFFIGDKFHQMIDSDDLKRS